MKKTLAKWASIILAIAGLSILAYGLITARGRLEELVNENNRLADSAEVLLVKDTESGQTIGELRAHLATSQEDALELLGEKQAVDRRNDALERELAFAGTANAELRSEIDGLLEGFTVDTAGRILLDFAGVKPSHGDTLGYNAYVTVETADPGASSMTAELFGSLTIDTRLVWEETTPICQVSARHADVVVSPGRCVEVLGASPIEEEAQKWAFGLDLGSPATYAIVGGGGLIIGLILGLVIP